MRRDWELSPVLCMVEQLKCYNKVVTGVANEI